MPRHRLALFCAALLSIPCLALAATRYDGLIGALARRYQIEPALVKAVIRCESNFDALAVSPKGAQGLMQLMPATQATLGVGDAFDPRQNIDAGARYLATLRQTFGADQSLLLAAYNAGPQAVIQAGYAVPDYSETQHYIACVETALQRYRGQPFNRVFAHTASDALDAGGLAVAPPRLPTARRRVDQRIQFQVEAWNTGPEPSYGIVSVTYPPDALSMIVVQTSPEHTTVALPTPSETAEPAATYAFLQGEWPQWSSGQRRTVTLAVTPRLPQDVMLHLSVMLYDAARAAMRQRWSYMARIPALSPQEDGSR